MPARPMSEAVLGEAVRMVREHGTVAAASRAAGIPYNTFQSRIRVARERGMLDGREIPTRGAKAPAVREGAPAAQRVERTETDGGLVVHSVHAEIRTVDDLIRWAKIDTDVFEVATQTANLWQQGSKLPDGSVAVVDLWQIKATFRRRRDADRLVALRRFLERSAKPRALPVPAWAKARTAKSKTPRGRRAATQTSQSRTRSVLLELSLPDIHIGKLAWPKETGEAYDVAIATRLYLRAVDRLLERTSHLHGRVKAVLLPIGNDLLHVDNPNDTTTAGTPQDTDGRWQRAFVAAHEMLDAAVRRCRQVAPVRVVVVPGNHDTTKSFCIGEVLAALYRGDAAVEVDNAPAMRKYVRHGRVLLGFTHGDKERHQDLALVMTRERAADAGACDVLEWHLGHLHKRAASRFVAGDTHAGIVVRVLPSLSATDAWHFRQGYVRGLRAAEAFAWCEREGLVLATEWRAEMDGKAGARSGAGGAG